MSEHHRIDIPPLSATNWADWSIQVRGELAARKVWGIIAGTRVQPSDLTTPEAVTYAADAEAASGLLIRYSGRDAHVHLKDLDDPLRMWADLKGAYNTPIPGSRLNALRVLLTIQMQPNESLDALARRVSEAHSRFLTLQDSSFNLDTLNSELFAMGLVQGMGDSFETLQTNILLQPAIKKDDVLAAVRAHQVQSDARSLDTTGTALYAAQNARQAAPTPSTLPTSPSPSKSCLWCKTKTHNTEECRSMARARDETKAKKGKGQSAQAAEQVAEFAGTASRSRSPHSTTTDTHWNPDTGATSHMTPQRGWIHDMKPHRVPIRLGDRSIVFSEGVGSVWFEPVIDGHPGPAVHISDVLYVPPLCSNLLSVLTQSAKHCVDVSIKGRSMVFSTGSGATRVTATVGDNCAAALDGRTLPIIPAPQKAYTAATTPLTRHRWHIRACTASTPGHCRQGPQVWRSHRLAH